MNRSNNKNNSFNLTNNPQTLSQTLIQNSFQTIHKLSKMNQNQLFNMDLPEKRGNQTILNETDFAPCFEPLEDSCFSKYYENWSELFGDDEEGPDGEFYIYEEKEPEEDGKTYFIWKWLGGDEKIKKVEFIPGDELSREIQNVVHNSSNRFYLPGIWEQMNPGYEIEGQEPCEEDGCEGYGLCDENHCHWFPDLEVEDEDELPQPNPEYTEYENAIIAEMNRRLGIQK